jgi:hypothetical protein
MNEIVRLAFRRGAGEIVLWEPTDGGVQITLPLSDPEFGPLVAADQPGKWGLTPLHETEMPHATWLALVERTRSVREAREAVVRQQQAAEGVQARALGEMQAADH